LPGSLPFKSRSSPGKALPATGLPGTFLPAISLLTFFPFPLLSRIEMLIFSLLPYKPGLGIDLNPDVVKAHLARGKVYWS
jgi:hypothetical protein